MDSIPVANPMPMKRPHFGRRLLLVAMLGLAVLAVIGVAVAAMLSSPGDGTVYAGDVEDLSVGSPWYYERSGFFLMRLEGGEVLALLDRDPHSGCTLEWQAGFEFAGRFGYFRDPCHNSVFQPDGTFVYGPAPRSMDRYEVSIQGGAVLVHKDRPLCWSDSTASYVSDACPND